MPSVRETALAALYASLNGQMLGTVRRDDGSAGTIPPAGMGALVTQEDGSLSATPILSPLQYDVQHEVPFTIEAYSRADVDRALQAIAGAVTGDQTLGGIIDWMDIDGPQLSADAPVGQSNMPMPRVFAADLRITMFYVAATAAG